MIYLDNASTTKPSENVKKAVMDAMENFGNPSSMHKLGIEAEKIIKNTRMSIAGVLGVRHEDIYFTSGGTEANNTAILGFCRRNKKRGMHIITTKIEHPSVLVPLQPVQVKVFTPVAVQVAAFVTAPLFQVCFPVAAMVCTSFFVVQFLQ